MESSKSAENLIDDPEQEVNIPGLKNVMSSDRTITRRIVWMSVFLICLGVICLQTIDRITYYNAGPVSMKLEFRTYNAIQVPRLTVCHRHFMRQDIIQNRKELLGRNQNKFRNPSLHDLLLLYDSIEDLWDNVKYNLEDIVLRCYVQGTIPCSDVGNWSTTLSIRGICYTYATNASLNPSNTMMSVYLTLHDNSTEELKNDTSWRLLIHGEKDDPAAEVTTKSLIIRPESVVDIRLKLRTFEFTSTSRKKCGEESMSTCFLNCINKRIYKQTNCRLPFMKDIEGPFCSTPSSYRTADTLIRKLILNSTMDCSCLLPCHHKMYDASVDSYSAPRQATVVNLFFDDIIYEYAREAPAYSLVAMFCDIGGSLGMFLGASVLTLVELIELIVTKIQKRYDVREKSEKKKGNLFTITDAKNKC